MKASRSAPAAQPLLALRVDATEGKNTRIVWVASLQCQMTGRPMMAAWPKSWAVSSAARWGRGWSGRRSELSLRGGEGARGQWNDTVLEKNTVPLLTTPRRLTPRHGPTKPSLRLC